MSSSKIMGYNLDDSVLDGVAQQSTSEEILEKVEGVNRSVESVGRRGEIYLYACPKSSGTITPLNVTGKGKLYYAIISKQLATGSGAVNVIVDGKTVYSETASTTNTSGGSHQVAIVNKDYICSVGSNMANTAVYFSGAYVGITSNVVNVTNYPYYVIDETSSVSVTGVDASGQAPRAVCVNGYIQFNSNLKIEMTNCFNGTYGHNCYFCYSLDED